MAKKIAELAVHITGNTSGLKSSFNDTKMQAGGLKGMLGNLKSSLMGIGPAAAAGIAAAGMAALGVAVNKVLNATIDYADEIEKTSLKMGLSYEATQEWKFVAEQLGTSLGSLENGMARFQKRIGEADDGLISSQRAFETLNIKIYDTNGNLRSMDDIMPETIKRLQEMEDTTKRNQLSMELFGRGGKELIPILSENSESIDELRQKAHDLGLVMSNENVEAGVKLKDTIHALKSALGGIIRSLGVELMPYMQKAADWIIDHMPQIKKIIKGAIDVIIFAFKTLYFPIEAVVKIIMKWYNWLELGFLHLKKITADTVSWLLDKLPLLEKLPFGIGEAVIQIRKNAEQISQETQEAIDSINKRSEVIKKNLEGLEKTQENNTAASFDFEEQAEDTAEALENLNAEFEELQTNEEKVLLKSIDLTEYIKDLKEELINVDIKANIFGKEIDVTSEKAGLLRNAIITLIDEGFNPNQIELRKLIDDYNHYNNILKAIKEAEDDLSKSIDDLTLTEADNIETGFVLSKYLKEIGNQLNNVEINNRIFGDSLDITKEKSDILKRAIMELIQQGLNPEHKEVRELIIQYRQLNIERDKEDTILDDLKLSIDLINKKEQALGDIIDVNSEKISLYKDAIIQLIEKGYDPQGEAISNLLAKIEELNKKPQIGPLEKLAREIDIINKKEAVFGELFDANTKIINLYTNTIEHLLEDGYEPQSEIITELIDKMKKLKSETFETARILKQVTRGFITNDFGGKLASGQITPASVVFEEMSHYLSGVGNKINNEFNIVANYQGMNTVEAKAANDDLVNKLQSRGVGGAFA